MKEAHPRLAVYHHSIFAKNAFQNYVKMIAEVLSEVFTMIKHGYAIPNANRIRIDVHLERYIFQSPIWETSNPHSTAVTSNMQSSVFHYFLLLLCNATVRRKRQVMDSLIVLVQEEHNLHPSQQRYLSLCRLHYILH